MNKVSIYRIQMKPLQQSAVMSGVNVCSWWRRQTTAASRADSQTADAQSVLNLSHCWSVWTRHGNTELLLQAPCMTHRSHHPTLDQNHRPDKAVEQVHKTDSAWKCFCLVGAKRTV